MSQTFIISSHQADRAGPHQDLYLQSSDVDFLAWVLPKGMPIKPGEKRLAIKVASHSVGAANFEGEIKEGYGKGTKEIWDEGTYIPYSHIMEQKPIRIEFHGSRVNGVYYLKHWADQRWLMWREAK